MSSRKLPDPGGLIKRARDKLNPKCAVRLSPFCDEIIGMRMQGVPYRDIEAWLVSQGTQYRIASPTIFRNFKSTKIEVRLTHAEELLESMGGLVDLDLTREMSSAIFTQKQRVDNLVRREKKKQKSIEGYSDKRIRDEIKILQDMIYRLNSMVNEAKKLDQEPNDFSEKENDIHLTPDGEKLLAQMIIEGDITMMGGLKDLIDES